MRSVLQALIAGKPVISYDIDGAREVVLNGTTGFLIPPKQVDLLAKSMMRLASSQEERVAMGTKGREMFTEQFRHETMTRKIRELYVQLINIR